MEQKRQYYVYHYMKSRKTSAKFGNLREARKFAIDCYRKGSFIELVNDKGTKLTL